MKWLNQTRQGKILLGAVFALACLVGALCCAGIMGAAQMECYDSRVGSYYDTDHYRTVMEWHANDLMQSYAVDGLQSDAIVYEAGNTNLRFRISTVYKNGVLGSELCSNMDDTKTQFGVWYLFVVQPDGHYASQIMEHSYGEFASQNAEAPRELEQKIETHRRTVRARLAAQLPQEALATAAVYQLELYATDPITVQGQGYYQNSLYNDSHLFDFLYWLRYTAVVLLAVCAAAALVSLTALFAGTGRYRGQEGIVFGWFDRIPMELSFVVLVALGVLSAVLVWEGAPALLDDAFYWVDASNLLQTIFAVGGLALVLTQWVCSAVAWLLAFARAAKSGRAFRGFVTVRSIGWLLGAVKRMALVPKVSLVSVGLVSITVLEFLLICSNSYIRLNGLTGLLLLLLILFWPMAVAYVVYGAIGMKKLDDCARMIAKGNYRVQVDTYLMPHHLRAHARTLENIAAGLNDAVAERTKSERMKTELITNVSHDLKTPLTSIINYTDLLQSQPLPEKAAEYAAVLARESARLKKLTEDLVEASKASSGAMSCEKQPTDLAELCAQALGEYAARLEGAGLAPVTDLPAEGLWANVDGRLVWRTLDNLLGNACKYALPGTRLYLTGRTRDDKAVLELKNISRAPLNITADELLARFVRGDASRSTEGSGLGLSIAQSLCQLQGGSFGLTVDGDLFKAELTFAGCDAPAAAVPQLPAEAAQKTPE